MTDIYNRPFSKNYSGLVNQSVIAVCLTVICYTTHEVFKRRRRGKHVAEGLGSRESWQFGYLYQGRSWAKNPSPPTPRGWPLSWVPQVVKFSEFQINELRGVDATLYIRFLRGCFWFTVIQLFTTLPILIPIHTHFSEGTVSPKSMTRASIASLVLTANGRSLLWIHICLLFWLTFTWMGIVVWIAQGAFRFRAQKIDEARERGASHTANHKQAQYHEHPHPQYPFQDVPSLHREDLKEGLRLRTVMVSNLPQQLRTEKELKEYFEYHMTRPIDKPSVGLNSSTQPGYLNRFFAFVFNRARRLPSKLPNVPVLSRLNARNSEEAGQQEVEEISKPIIDRVVVVRKMTQLASLLERREDVLRRLETAHIRLAKKAVLGAEEGMERRKEGKSLVPHAKVKSAHEKEHHRIEDEENTERMEHLIRTLGPFVKEFHPHLSALKRSKRALARHRLRKLISTPEDDAAALNASPLSPLDGGEPSRKTVWEALLELPRNTLDAYQPLVHLSTLFRNKTVPAIDYYTAKLNLLTSLINEHRSKAVTDYDPVSTAFVTFADPMDARKACSYLAVHPHNPLACTVTMAPQYQDLDWIRLMKSSFKVEFVKDWVVNIGVWVFTIMWIFPVSLLVGLVSIQSISTYVPKLKAYLDRHSWEEELIQSFLPTILVSLLALLIPLILLLIAKKAHTITTLSALHDRIMTRFYKFLIVNVLVFFCVGTAAVQSLLLSFKSSNKNRPSILNIIATSFPTAGPFYVGWLIFTTALHSGFEIALFGLPLILYPSTKRQVTPRKRTVGIRPRTFNFYYWLPNHLLIIHILLLFSLLNPLVIPFALIYFFVQNGVVRNQLIHVYAKNYELDGQLMLIRIVRYSLDGLMLAQGVFLAYMAVLKKTANVVLAAVLIVFTAVVKLAMTRVCRAQFEAQNILEAQVVCGIAHNTDDATAQSPTSGFTEGSQNALNVQDADVRHPSMRIWKLPAWANFSYNTIKHRPNPNLTRRQPIPFATESSKSNEKSKEPEQRPNIVTHSSKENLDDEWKPVTTHPPPVPWDDDAHVDLPYDNPYYTRPINDILWLPRNPFGLLDLDDTIDLKISMTTDTKSQQIGTWLGFVGNASPVSLTAPALPLFSGSSPSIALQNTPRIQYTGLEKIDLPEQIAKRVEAIHLEEDVEHASTNRPSLFYRKNSNTSRDEESQLGTGKLSFRRPSFLEGTLPVGGRSFSVGTAQGRGRSTSFTSFMGPARTQRSASQGPETASQPETQIQAEFLDAVQSNAEATRSNLSVIPPTLSRAKKITTHEAVINEVLVEEEKALKDRIREESEEAAASNSTKSWLTRWMFRNVDDGV